MTTYPDYLNSTDREISELVLVTNTIAESTYIDYGKIIQVINDKGDKVNFIPSEKDIKYRSLLLNHDQLRNWQIHNLNNAWVWGIAVLFSAIFFGLLSVRLQKLLNNICF